MARLVGRTGARFGARGILPLDRLGVVARLRPFDLARLRGPFNLPRRGRLFSELARLGWRFAKLARLFMELA
jgi:hypothetical protein